MVDQLPRGIVMKIHIITAGGLAVLQNRPKT